MEEAKQDIPPPPPPTAEEEEEELPPPPPEDDASDSQDEDPPPRESTFTFLSSLRHLFLANAARMTSLPVWSSPFALLDGRASS